MSGSYLCHHRIACTYTGCDSSYYRSGDTCVNCPDKSNRTMSTDDDSSCPCFANYQRRNEDNADEECVRKSPLSENNIALRKLASGFSPSYADVACMARELSFSIYP